MNIFVDTGGWIAYFDAADDYHAVVDGFFRQTLQDRTHQLFTSDAVIVETVTHIRYSVGADSHFIVRGLSIVPEALFQLLLQRKS